MYDLVKVFKALGDKNRLRILKMLQQKNMCVCEIAETLGITQPSVSKHLSILKDAGLVTDSRDGQWIEYSLTTNPYHNDYVPVLLKHLHGWINDDPCIKKDKVFSRSLLREKICKKHK